MKLKSNTWSYAIILFINICLPTCYAITTNFVTYGSIIKLLNFDYGFRLHSHDVKYGSGSGQQSVTGVDIKEDINSHWVTKAATNDFRERGERIKCGSVIRLEHLSTKKNLHSHQFASPLSGEQEVSAYGIDGVGDAGDHWKIICLNEEWLRDAQIHLQHVKSGAYLGLSGRSFGRPIAGQMEIVALSSEQHGTLWSTAEGLYIIPKNNKSEVDHSHSEL